MAARFVTIAPSGGNYTSLSAAEAGEQAIGANLVSAGDTLEMQYQGDWSAGADTTACTINGFTTGASNWILISTDAANRWEGEAWNTSKARIEPSGNAISVLDDYVSIVGLQAHSTGSGSGVLSRNANCLVDSCHVRGRIGVISTFNSTAAINVRNTLASDGSGSTLRSGFSAEVSGALIRCHSCTYAGTACSSTDPAFNAVAGSTMIAVNCIGYDSTVGAVLFGGAGTLTQSYNISSDATAAGTGSITSATFTFVNAAGGDFRIDGSDTSGAIGGGTDLSADANLPVTVDAGGQTRPTTPTMGMWEVNPAGGGTTLSLTGTTLTITSAAGSVALGTSKAVSGATTGVAAVAGSVAPSVAKSLTGTAGGIVAAPGQVSPALAIGVTGASLGISAVAGPVSPTLTLGLTGEAQTLALAAGSVSVSVDGSVTLSLSGAALNVAMAAGTLAPALSLSLTGSGAEIAAQAGTVSPALSVGLTGSELGVAVAVGQISPSLSLSLSGAGVTLNLATGSVSVDGAQAQDPIPHLVATWTPGRVLTASHTPGLRLTATWSSSQ